MKASIAAIVLAAGASRRLGEPKQLLMHEGETLVARAVRLANEAGAEPLLVVLGANLELVRDAVSLAGSIPVINQNWERGISTSIQAGLDALDEAVPDAAGTLILACDQPLLTVEHLRALIETFATQAEPSIVASAYAGVLGIPAVFPRTVFPHLHALRGDKGARALMVDPPCTLIGLPFSGGEVDIDQPGDLSYLA